MLTDLKFWASLVDGPWSIFIHLVDIGIVAWLIYRLIKSLAGTKIMSLIQGVILFILLKFVSEWLGLATISYLMNQVITYGVIAGVVIFAPEIRSGLEHFGRTARLLKRKNQQTDNEKLIEDLLTSVYYMSPRKIGALIAIEQTQTLQEYISTGIPLEADVSSQLLTNIFTPNTPLHDGAVIIQNNKIATACSYLPLSDSMTISKEFGTRHRAAIGLSEVSDALTIIVSEETGGVSITYKSQFLHDLSKETFENIIRERLSDEEDEESVWFHKIWRKKA